MRPVVPPLQGFWQVLDQYPGRRQRSRSSRGLALGYYLWPLRGRRRHPFTSPTEPRQNSTDRFTRKASCPATLRSTPGTPTLILSVDKALPSFGQPRPHPTLIPQAMPGTSSGSSFGPHQPMVALTSRTAGCCPDVGARVALLSLCFVNLFSGGDQSAWKPFWGRCVKLVLDRSSCC